MDRENSNITILTVKIEIITEEDTEIITTTTTVEVMEVKITKITIVIIKEGTTVTTVKMAIVLIT